jgi:chitin disaccharide deacetylase
VNLSPQALDFHLSSIPLRYAVINGDDFGFSEGVNSAIIQAHTQGVLTSTSLMVTGAAFEQAVDLARSHPSLGVGLHLTLVCGRSALPAQAVPHLVDHNGFFSDSPGLAGLKYQFNRAARRELRLEIRAQLEKFRQTGLPLSHVDGHLHLHVHPVVISILIELSAEFGIRVIRLPFEELCLALKLDSTGWVAKVMGWAVFAQLRRLAQPQLTKAGIAVIERVYGLLQSGDMTEAYLMGLIPGIRANWVEIYLHPAIALPGEPLNGPGGSGEQELAALLSDRVRDGFEIAGFTLTNYCNPEIFSPQKASQKMTSKP